jgi:asparagine synthase (glutamine-hydrolysing)
LRKVSIDSNDNFVPQAIESPSGLSLPETIEAALLERVEGHNHAALSLSGGYDSTILASELARLQFPVTTFSMKFNNSDKEKFSSDALHAEQIAKKLGLNNVVIEMPTADKIEVILQEYVMAMEEPNSNPTGLSMMVLYKEIFNRGNRLVLTGDGADEVFGGYERFNLANKFHKTPKINSKFLNKIIITKNPRLGWLSKLSYVLEPNQSIESWLYWHLICGNSMTDRLHISNQMASIHIFGDELINLFGNDKSACLLYRDLRTWLSMESNKKLDRISMWHSIEARSPFQSEHVIGNGFRLMNKENFRKNKKEIFLNSFPVLTELPTIPKKTGFISPLGYWLRNNESLINKSISGLQDFMSLDSKICKELKNSPKEYDFYRMRVLWNLIVLNCWYQSQL